MTKDKGLPSPRPPNVIHAELLRVAWVKRSRQERASSSAISWKRPAELMVNRRNSRAAHAPAIVRLELRPRRHDQRHRLRPPPGGPTAPPGPPPAPSKNPFGHGSTWPCR